MQTLTAQNYHTFVENNEYTVVDYYTDWLVSTDCDTVVSSKKKSVGAVTMTELAVPRTDLRL